MQPWRVEDKRAFQVEETANIKALRENMSGGSEKGK